MRVTFVFIDFLFAKIVSEELDLIHTAKFQEGKSLCREPSYQQSSAAKQTLCTNSQNNLVDKITLLSDPVLTRNNTARLVATWRIHLGHCRYINCWKWNSWSDDRL